MQMGQRSKDQADTSLKKTELNGNLLFDACMQWTTDIQMDFLRQKSD